MSSKRLFEFYGSDSDDHNTDNQNRHAGSSSLLPTVDADEDTTNIVQSFWSSFEPMLRRVVKEEVAVGLDQYARLLTSSSSLHIQSQEQPTLKLIFDKNPSPQLFTLTKITDINDNALLLSVVDMGGNHQMTAPIKVEIVVLNGDFPKGDSDTWTSEEFDRNIVRERTGKRPLLAGELNLTMREGFVTIVDIEFTDNSSWIRSRKFRLGARIVQGKSQGQVVKIKEAMTQPFVVKDHRGELYKKHHPPMLGDEVWRLEKVAKEGVFHKKLTSSGIHSVQDFLKLSVVDPLKLRRIMSGMSDKVWEITLKHARSCVIGSKLYIHRGPNHNIVCINSICQIVKAVINGQTLANQDLKNINRTYAESLVREAYSKWNTLEEIDELTHQTPIITQGELLSGYSNYEQTASMMTRIYEKSPNNEWGLESTAAPNFIQTTPNEPNTNNNNVSIPYNFSESSSDC